MKLLVLLALVSVAFSAPQPRKVFHENFEDFIDVIEENAGAELDEILNRYEQYEEFWTTVQYLSTPKFKGLIYEMEDLPEFRAVLDFLESHSIDVSYFVNLLNDMLEYGGPQGVTRQSGRDFTAFSNDVIAALPKAKLAALYEQKLAEDADFRAAIEGLESDEFQQLYDALWQNEVFLAEVKILADNGIDVGVLLVELVALFGQN